MQKILLVTASLDNSQTETLYWCTMAGNTNFCNARVESAQRVGQVLSASAMLCTRGKCTEGGTSTVSLWQPDVGHSMMRV